MRLLAALALLLARQEAIPGPVAPLLVAIALSALLALTLSRPRGVARRASQAARSRNGQAPH